MFVVSTSLLTVNTKKLFVVNKETWKMQMTSLTLFKLKVFFSFD